MLLYLNVLHCLCTVVYDMMWFDIMWRGIVRYSLVWYESDGRFGGKKRGWVVWVPPRDGGGVKGGRGGVRTTLPLNPISIRTKPAWKRLVFRGVWGGKHRHLVQNIECIKISPWFFGAIPKTMIGLRRKSSGGKWKQSAWVFWTQQ